MFLCSGHSNFSSLHREFFQIPSLAVWFLSNIFSDKFISDKFYLRLSPTWGIELGRAWILHSRALHLDTSPSHPPSLMTAFVYLPASVPVQCTSWLTWHVREMCLWRARTYGRFTTR